MNWAKFLLMNLGAGLLVLSPFLPGPPNGLVKLFYNAGQILGLFGVFAIPVGLIWTTKELKRKKNDKQYQVDSKAIILLTLPLTLFLTAIFVAEPIRNFSRDFAINRTEQLIQSIEKFKANKGQYPNSLTDLIPQYINKIPSPFIMGIDKYHYQKHGDKFTVSFQQNVILNFNFEVVTFDPTDNHKADGKLVELYETGKSHWKYYVYD